MKTVLNVKTDQDIKAKAQRLAEHIGVPLSTVVNAYLKEFVSSGEFRLSREPQLKPEVARRIAQSVQEARTRKNVSPRFANADKAIAYLNSL